MTMDVLLKLLAIAAVVGVGWVTGRTRWLGSDDAARVLSNAAFLVFTPALLFRTTARIDLTTLPWALLAAFFVPVVGFALAVYGIQRRRGREDAPAPAVRTISSIFGNQAQLGVPMAAALFGEAGLAVHLTILSLHALTLLTLLTLLVETDVARAQARTLGARPHLGRLLWITARNTVIHPVVLPVIAGLAFNLTGASLPGAVDEILLMFAQAVVPLCLLAIGMSLAHYGLGGSLREALPLAAAKLLLLPGLVALTGYFVAGLRGLPLTVMVMAAGMPTGSNALMFAQRYRSREGEATATIVLSTAGFVATAPLWLWLLLE